MALGPSQGAPVTLTSHINYLELFDSKHFLSISEELSCFGQNGQYDSGVTYKLTVRHLFCTTAQTGPQTDSVEQCASVVVVCGTRSVCFEHADQAEFE